jgi:hypothetical protein
MSEPKDFMENDKPKKARIKNIPARPSDET